MKRRIAAVLIIAMAAGALTGCSRTEEPAREEQEAQADLGPTGEASDAARLQGLAMGDTGAGEAPMAEIALNNVTYEWRTTPTRGVYVEIGFINPHDEYERARGHVFIVAGTSSFGDVRGIYPAGARFDDEYPKDFSDGTRLLFRKTDEIKVLIPYTHSEGYYEWLRVLVYGADGRLLIESGYDIEDPGVPAGPKKPGKSFAL
jgi:hypothetical protein